MSSHCRFEQSGIVKFENECHFWKFHDSGISVGFLLVQELDEKLYVEFDGNHVEARGASLRRAESQVRAIENELRAPAVQRQTAMNHNYSRARIQILWSTRHRDFTCECRHESKQNVSATATIHGFPLVLADEHEVIATFDTSCRFIGINNALDGSAVRLLERSHPDIANRLSAMVKGISTQSRARLKPQHSPLCIV